MIVAKGKHINLVKTEDDWEYVDRSGGVREIVSILAITPDGNLLLVEQYRPPVDSRVIELPAGLVGDVESNEQILDAGKRELEEETGYKAEIWREIPCGGPSSAGLTSERVKFLLAYGLTKVAEGDRKNKENIEVHEIPLSIPFILKWMEEKRGEGVLIDPKIFGPLFYINHQTQIER